MQRQYTGEFLKFDGQNLGEILDEQPTTGETYGAIVEALDILSGRTLAELDCIARRIEAVIVSQVGARLGAELGQAPAAALGLDAVRRTIGDLNLWEEAGGEDAPSTPEAALLPAGVTGSEYMAAMAMWKALQLREVTRSALRALNEAPEDDPAFILRGSNAVGERARLQAALLRPGEGMFEIAELSAEVVRAATMAGQAEYLEWCLTTAKHDSGRQFEDRLKQQMRERGAKGGRRKGEGYRPAKDKILQLYREGGYTGSRAAAAGAIFQKLCEMGDEMPYSRVLRTLENEDRRVKTEREAKARADSASSENNADS
jgi:hypothetical protein